MIAFMIICFLVYMIYQAFVTGQPEFALPLAVVGAIIAAFKMRRAMPKALDELDRSGASERVQRTARRGGNGVLVVACLIIGVALYLFLFDPMGRY